MNNNGGEANKLLMKFGFLSQKSEQMHSHESESSLLNNLTNLNK